MILTTIVSQSVEVSFDTDTFTKDQWKSFILENVSVREIMKAKQSDMFYIEMLKEKAIASWKKKQEPLDWI